MTVHQEPQEPFTLTGVYSKEFLEKMGYKEFVPPVIHTVGDGPTMPMVPIKLAFALNLPHSGEDKNETL